jgi:hypothetical protein
MNISKMPQIAQFKLFFLSHLLCPLKLCKLASMNYIMRSISKALFILLLALSMPNIGSGQSIQFSHPGGAESALPERSARRIERFLSHQFPMRQMKRCAREECGGTELKSAQSRSVTYQVIAQDGINFVLAAYSAEWNEPVNEMAIYRMEPDGPNQVWRSRAWVGSSGDLHFFTEASRDKNIVLFEEGGSETEFGLASVFTFTNAPQGLYLRDLTPELPWLRARAHFPFRALYAERISMRTIDNSSKHSGKGDIVLSASDEEYNLGMAQLVRPGRSWKYNAVHNRFERMNTMYVPGLPEATSNR